MPNAHTRYTSRICTTHILPAIAGRQNRVWQLVMGRFGSEPWSGPERNRTEPILGFGFGVLT